MGKLKAKARKATGRLNSTKTPNHDERPAVFSLEKLDGGDFCFSKLSKECRQMFADAIFRRKNMTWKDIKLAPRHGLGTEKISSCAIKAPPPRFVKGDVSDYLAFRYNGKKAMVGVREKDVFYVLWFDPTFTLYKHG